MRELTVVAPCFNERENVELLVQKLDAALGEISWEVIFVDDDSPDGTAETVRKLAREDARVRCIQRIGRRGLSTAVVEGMLASSAPYLVVIDADLQHDEAIIPQMLLALRDDNSDIAIGSRYIAGGGLGEWDKTRAAMSGFATTLSRLVVKQHLSDPMSGFFMITRGALDGVVRKLSGQGFKILLDIFASSSQALKVREIPYVFRQRQFGESKLDSLVLFEYSALLLDKMSRGLLPIRFILFSLVGGIGLFVHLAVLRGALVWVDFVWAQSIGTIAAIASNYFINNILTYRDRRLKGSKFVVGLLKFYAVCGIGAIANVGIASAIFDGRFSWFASAIAGIAVSVVWNYAVSSFIVWKR